MVSFTEGYNIKYNQSFAHILLIHFTLASRDAFFNINININKVFRSYIANVLHSFYTSSADLATVTPVNIAITVRSRLFDSNLIIQSSDDLHHKLCAERGENVSPPSRVCYHKCLSCMLLTFCSGILFRTSEVGIGNDLVVSIDRTSSTAALNRSDPIVERIMPRASTFQGYISLQDHETLQMRRYSAGQEYKPHWDHNQYEPVPCNATQRVTTFLPPLRHPARHVE